MIGRLLGRYRLVREIGSGGMGTVYEAVSKDLGKRVAIKLLRAGTSAGPEALARFFNEARAASSVEHRSVVSAFEFDQTPEGDAYIVMEYLEGESLRSRMRARQPMVPAKVVALGAQLASALAATHQKRIIHRDLKPDNVMLVVDAEAMGRERAKILDFGIAKLAKEEDGGAGSVKTRTGQLLGTPTYMAPEQCRGTVALTEKVDVYSLGVLFYEMLAGRPPFQTTGFGEMMAMHMFADPPPVQQLVPTLPPRLSALIGRMMVKDPDARPAMAPVAKELAELSPELGPIPDAPPPSPRLPEGSPDAVPTMTPIGELSPMQSAQIRERLHQTGQETERQARQFQLAGRHRRALVGAALVAGLGGLLAIGAWRLKAGAQLTAAEHPPAVAVVVAASPAAIAAVRASSGDSVAQPVASTASGPEVDDLEAAAEAALTAGKPKVALRQIRKALALAPKRRSLLRISCLAQRALGQAAKAESVCQAAGVGSSADDRSAAVVPATATPARAAAGQPIVAPAGGAPAANPPPSEHDAYQVDFLR